MKKLIGVFCLLIGMVVPSFAAITHLETHDIVSNYLVGLDFDASGNIHVLNHQRGDKVFDSDWNFIDEYGGLSLGYPKYISLAQSLAIFNNKIYVTDLNDGGYIKVYSLSGEHLSTFDHVGSDSTELNSPYDIEVSPWGTLFILDTENKRIVEMDSNDEYIREISIPHLNNSSG